MSVYEVFEEILAPEAKRAIALKRAEELKSKVADYLQEKEKIATGFALQEEITRRKEKLMEILNATEEQWQDWRWQLRSRISDVETLAKVFELSEIEKRAILRTGSKFRWAVSPYYATLIEKEKDPIWQQAIPSIQEITDQCGLEDPMAEEFTSPAPGITRRYPDRLIINVTNQCAMYCRHCQRRRNIGEVDQHQPKQVLEEALEYIRVNPEIRDVLLTGGDALLLADLQLEWLLGEFDQISHVEIKRLGTRTIVTLPQRITPELCSVLERHPPIYINTQFNHPREITPEVALACSRLIKAGVVLGNQAVLLKGVNDNPHVMKKLHQELLKIRVRPYYIFQAKPVRGTSHFITSIEDGISIMEKLRGYTSGLAVPTYIVNAPGGYGKIPVLPSYVRRYDKNKWLLKTWEGKKILYSNLIKKQEENCVIESGIGKLKIKEWVKFMEGKGNSGLIVNEAGTGLGSIRISEEVVKTIAGLAAAEIPGVADLSGGIVGGIVERLGRKNLSKGIKAEVGEKEAAIDLHVIVEYGNPIHEVAAQIQHNVKVAVEKMTGLKVVKVNVNVQGITSGSEGKEEMV